jgi:hypothetical protein
MIAENRLRSLAKDSDWSKRLAAVRALTMLASGTSGSASGYCLLKSMCFVGP